MTGIQGIGGGLTVIDGGVSKNVPTTGFSHTIPDGTWHMLYKPAGALASGTITLPQAKHDGHMLDIRTTQTIEQVAWVGQGGQSLANPPPTLLAGAVATALYDFATTTWVFSNANIGTPLAPGNLTFYVDGGAGSDTTGNGSAAKPFATIQHGLVIAALFNYSGLYYPTINVADATYSENLILPQFVNVISTTGVQLIGNVSTPANVVIKSMTQIDPAAVLTIDGFTFTPTGSFPTAWLISSGAGRIGNIRFDPGSSTRPLCMDVENGGQLLLDFGSTKTVTLLNGSYNQFLHIGGGSNVTIGGGNLTVASGSAGFFNFIDMNGSVVFWDYINVTGTINGRRLLANGFNEITTSTGVQTDIPGSTDWFLNTQSVVLGTDNGTVGLYGVNGGGFPIASSGPPDSWQVGFNTGIGGTQDPGKARGLWFYDGSFSYFAPCTRAINAQTGDYTTVFTDQEGVITVNSAGAHTVTIDTDANLTQLSTGLPVGTEIRVMQLGAGAVTIAAAGGVTGHNFGSLVQWQTAVVRKIAANEWVQTGA